MVSTINFNKENRLKIELRARNEKYVQMQMQICCSLDSLIFSIWGS